MDPNPETAKALVPAGEPLTLDRMQALVDEWITGTGKGYFSPLTNAVILAEEGGVMARKYGDQKAKPGDKACLADELADLMWVLTAIANQTGINLTEAFAANMAKKNSRDKGRF